MSETTEKRLKQLGIELPAVSAPVANYLPFMLSGDLLFIAGQLSRRTDGTVVEGRLGGSLTVEDGAQAARLAALSILTHARTALGSLDRISQTLRVTGFVNATADFVDHPKVLNGASDLFVEVLGEKGRHTRMAVGAASLPSNAAVEVDALFRVTL